MIKKVFAFILAFVCLCSPVFALEGDLSFDAPAELPQSVDEINNSDVWEITDIETFSVAPVSPSDAEGLKKVLLTFLGSYDPVIVEYEYKNYNNNYYSYLREVQPDYVWIASFILLALFVYCLFRLGGGLLG